MFCACYEGNIYQSSPDKTQFLKYGFINNKISNIVCNQDGDIFCACYDGSIYWCSKRDHKFTKIITLGNGIIYITKDNFGNVYVAGNNTGVYKCSKGKKLLPVWMELMKLLII